ncbi:3-oxoacyl-ACP synthase [Pleurocapsa sp. CCALA 161]|uniref:beta-ketoacyl-ACP synthase n=1 Tax=Pleurocapsa sp. CCALA 161 TaxID=2107688 RepID=UPI000D0784A3|nr:beta-ketoacyl-ACP synthase [Pleurocapsa sp. CCALA 161]PSB10980.1 3-oxoacyl-ACP synthase [Pleurocapsa sp. CCALA 161]
MQNIRHDVVVTGIGLSSCLGSLQTTWSSILQDKSGIKLHQLFPQLPAYPLGMIDSQPSLIDDLTQKILSDALQDAKLQVPLTQTGVVIGSSRGCQATWEQIASQIHNHQSNNLNFDWLQTFPHQPAIITGNYLQTTAPVLAPMAACATGIWALARGYQLIRTGRCARVIAGAVETPISPLTLAAFEQMNALANKGCYPFDRFREGLVLGEGGAMFVLETAELAARRQTKIYGKINGFGLTCDAHHVSAPQVVNGSAARAIKQSLERSNLEPREIDYVHAHGTSTVLNDRHEAQLIQQIFPQVAVSSSKGATGHTLGASGAINTALTLMAMKHNCLPPCVGLKNLEFDLNVVTQPRSAQINHAMCFSFGFGGQNAVIIVSQ